MAQSGLDAENPGDVERFRALTIERHCEDLSALIRRFHPEASIYFNGLTAFGRPQNLRYRLYRWNTKNDLEDLPTTWGGYDKFPLRAKRFLKEDKPIVAMSGKFHTSWGEFGGFKSPEALRYEAASMIAFGSRCNFGDQMHPYGVMDMTTYENIGHAFRYVERIEALGIGGRPVASLGLWLANDLPADEGVARMLLEEHCDFEVVGPDDDLSRFEAIVVPSAAGALDGARPAIAAYVKGGGRLLLLGSGLLDAAGADPLPEAGVEYLGEGRFDVDYTVAPAGLAPALPASPFLNYQSALRLQPRRGTEALAAIREPYFSRTYGAYCGHQNTPYRLEDAGHPAVTRRAGVIACAHALDRLYYSNGAYVHRALFAGLLRSLHGRPMVHARDAQRRPREPAALSRSRAVRAAPAVRIAAPAGALRRDRGHAAAAQRAGGPAAADRRPQPEPRARRHSPRLRDRRRDGRGALRGSRVLLSLRGGGAVTPEPERPLPPVRCCRVCMCMCILPW